MHSKTVFVQRKEDTIYAEAAGNTSLSPSTVMQEIISIISEIAGIRLTEDQPFMEVMLNCEECSRLDLLPLFSQKFDSLCSDEGKALQSYHTTHLASTTLIPVLSFGLVHEWGHSCVKTYCF